jgi:hypothetical protein
MVKSCNDMEAERRIDMQDPVKCRDYYRGDHAGYCPHVMHELEASGVCRCSPHPDQHERERQQRGQ